RSSRTSTTRVSSCARTRARSTGSTRGGRDGGYRFGSSDLCCSTMILTVAAGLVGELDAEHPELLLELADDLDQDVLRGEVELAQPVHAPADALRHRGKPRHELAHDDLGLEWAAFDGWDLAARADGARLAVGEEPERDAALGDGVGEVAPRVDQLVEVLVQRLEERADDAPVQLLAEHGEVDELDQRRLQVAPDLGAPVAVDRRQV